MLRISSIFRPVGLRELQNLSAQQWLDRASRVLPQLLSAVLVVAIAWQLVQLTWLLLDRPADGAASGPLAYTPVEAPQPRGLDVQDIVNARLFGVAEAPAEQVATDAPQTQMNLVLSAVFAAEDPAKGLAIIGESAQSAKVYTVGRTIRSGTRLHAVYADRVILDRGGRLETLPLPKQSSAALAVSRPAAAPQPTRFAQDLRRMAQTNPTALARVVRPQPVFANGVQRGFRVYPGQDRKMFAQLGLQPGDLVLTINGTPLDDPQRAMEIFNTIETSNQVNLTIERNGQTQELTLNTAQIALPEVESTTPEAQPESGQAPDAAQPAE
ncbi:MAG TPA: type II secretion system protein GspC [Steroidobacter sp.]|nr:type II secretion system protein GspC [Steroidobacteraceae bacterium]HLS81889.1 type II secretion system protein GspC [Steroidobacter sp.]